MTYVHLVKFLLLTTLVTIVIYKAVILLPTGTEYIISTGTQYHSGPESDPGLP